MSQTEQQKSTHVTSVNCAWLKTLEVNPIRETLLSCFHFFKLDAGDHEFVCLLECLLSSIKSTVTISILSSTDFNPSVGILGRSRSSKIEHLKDLSIFRYQSYSFGDPFLH